MDYKSTGEVIKALERPVAGVQDAVAEAVRVGDLDVEDVDVVERGGMFVDVGASLGGG
jgi:hypothetical protein